MTPIERNIKEFLDAHTDKQTNKYILLYNELTNKSGRWTTDEDKQAVAKFIKEKMELEKKWNKERLVKDMERTVYIKGILKES